MPPVPRLLHGMSVYRFDVQWSLQVRGGSLSLVINYRVVRPLLGGDKCTITITMGNECPLLRGSTISVGGKVCTQSNDHLCNEYYITFAVVVLFGLHVVVDV